MADFCEMERCACRVSCFSPFIDRRMACESAGRPSAWLALGLNGESGGLVQRTVPSSCVKRGAPRRGTLGVSEPGRPFRLRARAKSQKSEEHNERR